MWLTHWALALLLGTTAPTAEVASLSAKVIYLAGSTVYIDAGRLEGLGEGDTLEVRREAKRVATLRVNFLASHRATCIPLGEGELPVVGDSVVFVARNALGPAVAAAPPDASPSPVMTRAVSPQWLRGRVGVRYLSVRNGSGSHFEQPMFDVRAEGTGASPIDLLLDLRGRRTSQSFANGEDRREAYTRTYRASLTWHDRTARKLITVGRQSSGAVGPVSLFDGVLAQTGNDRWSTGVFAGTQPNPMRMQISSDVREYGVFAERRQAPLAARRWSLGLGAISSYDHSAPDRDFAYLQASYRGARASAYGSQEVDFNRAWKRQRGEDAVSLTSTFATSRLTLTPGWELNAGYDNRRSVLLWRDHETPETQFDDRYRQGAWIGSSGLIARQLRLAAELRTNGAGSDRANAWSVSADLQRSRWLGLALRSRYARSESDPNASRLLSLGVGLDPLPPVHLGWTAGQRTFSQVAFAGESTTRWQEWTADYTFRRRWYANASYERDRGDAGDLSQFYTGLSRRF